MRPGRGHGRRSREVEGRKGQGRGRERHGAGVVLVWSGERKARLHLHLSSHLHSPISIFPSPPPHSLASGGGKLPWLLPQIPRILLEPAQLRPCQLLQPNFPFQYFPLAANPHSRPDHRQNSTRRRGNCHRRCFVTERTLSVQEPGNRRVSAPQGTRVTDNKTRHYDLLT